jgi:peptidoglycan/xylan/chitin deacetylase (PgdA/CDA1 family)
MKKILFLLCGAAIVLTACGNIEKVKHEEYEQPKKEAVKESEKIVQDKKKDLESASHAAARPEENPNKSKYVLNETNWTLVPKDQANRKVVLLTIDDAPDKHALEMAQILKSLHVNAIFFVNGHFIDSKEEKDVLKQLHDMGFVIGNHTYSHQKLKDLPEEKQKEEIVKLNDEIEAVIGERPKFFRAPFGINTDFSREIVAKGKMLLMNWTYGYDWEKQYQNADALADIMIHSPYLTDGANLLMHDRPWTKDALEKIVKGFQAKGYEILDPKQIETPI